MIKCLLCSFIRYLYEFTSKYYIHTCSFSFPLSFDEKRWQQRGEKKKPCVHIYEHVFVTWYHRSRVHIVTLSLNFRSLYLSFKFARHLRLAVEIWIRLWKLTVLCNQWPKTCNTKLDIIYVCCYVIILWIKFTQ